MELNQPSWEKGMTKKDRRKIEQIIKIVEDRDVLLRKAGMLGNARKNVQSSKTKSKWKKLKQEDHQQSGRT
ncbi:MAG: hypothetical protein ABR955_08635 [Verrucomicrobiota bacterium]